MAKFPLTAVVLGPKSGSDRWHEFSIDRDPETTPADEIVETFMTFLHDQNELPDPNSYELNSAIRSRNENVVMCLGTLFFSNEQMPFAAMISW